MVPVVLEGSRQCQATLRPLWGRKREYIRGTTKIVKPQVYETCSSEHVKYGFSVDSSRISRPFFCIVVLGSFRRVLHALPWQQDSIAVRHSDSGS